jgi:hypothetical protein
LDVREFLLHGCCVTGELNKALQLPPLHVKKSNEAKVECLLDELSENEVDA